MTRAPLLAVTLFIAGCAPATVSSSSSESPLIGGTPAPNATAVFALDIRGDNGVTSSCTATLIASRTLLTAAHCIDPAVLGASSLTVIATNAPTTQDIVPGVNTWTAVQTKLHPDWRPQFGLANDLGAVLLESAPDAGAPVPWNRAPLEGRTGQMLRVFGYGSNDGTDAGMGVRREVELMINQVTPTNLYVGDMVSKGLCHGDSGGPSLLMFNDGVERLAGIHSYTRTPDCLDGADLRVDAFRLTIADWLALWENACDADGLCASSCTTPDPDCAPLGERCLNAIECSARLCITDQQHPESYCSQSCVSAACPAGLSCQSGTCVLPQLPTARLREPCTPGATYCLDNTRCDGVSMALAVCSPPCTTSASCARGEECRPGFSGQFVCVRAPIELPIAKWSGKAASGCSSTGEDARNMILAVAYVFGLARARRRRNG